MFLLLFFSGDVTLLQELAAVFRRVFETGVIPGDWRQGIIIIIRIFKGNGDRRKFGGHHVNCGGETVDVIEVFP